MRDRMLGYRVEVAKSEVELHIHKHINYSLWFLNLMLTIPNSCQGQWLHGLLACFSNGNRETEQCS